MQYVCMGEDIVKTFYNSNYLKKVAMYMYTIYSGTPQ